MKLGIGAAAAADPPARTTLPRARPEPLPARVPALARAHAGNGAGHHEAEERRTRAVTVIIVPTVGTNVTGQIVDAGTSGWCSLTSTGCSVEPGRPISPPSTDTRKARRRPRLGG